MRYASHARLRKARGIDIFRGQLRCTLRLRIMHILTPGSVRARLPWVYALVLGILLPLLPYDIISVQAILRRVSLFIT